MTIPTRSGKSIFDFLFLLLLFVAQNALAQTTSQLVKNKKHFVCLYDRTEAKTAAEACQHFVKFHREGWTVTKPVEREDGTVMCTCQKTEDGDIVTLEEAGMQGEIICPPFSSEVLSSNSWQQTMCGCVMGYVARNDQCVPEQEAGTAKKGGVREAAAGSRKGKAFTTKEKTKVINANAEKNGGRVICDSCKTETTKPERSTSGKTPPKTDRQVDHIEAKSKGGSGTAENGQVLCRTCNRRKGNK